MSALHRVALASTPEAREAAEEVLAQAGAAVDAVIAGFAAAAAVHPWVLFAPVTVAVAGVGSGVRFIDGRARQPGQGFERPLRHPDDASVPPIALVSAPVTPAALALAHAMFSRAPWSTIAAPALRVAKREGASSRAALLAELASKKALMLSDRTLLTELRARVARIDGALLGPEDLEAPSLESAQGTPHAFGARPGLVAPWAFDEALAGVTEAGRLLVVAADPSGGLAAVVADRPARVLPLFDGEIELPLLAQPMLKGVPRVRPGAPLPMAAPCAIAIDGDRPFAAVASARRSIDDQRVEALLDPLGTLGSSSRGDDLLIARAPARPVDRAS